MSEGLHLHIHMIKGMNLNTNPFLRDTIIIVTLIHFFDTIIINIRLRHASSSTREFLFIQIKKSYSNSII